MSFGKFIALAVLFFGAVTMSARSADLGLKRLPGHVPAAVSKLIAKSRLSATNRLSLAIGLPLRNEAELDEFIRELYDPASPNFHKFIQPVEFTARFGPTEADYAAVRKFAEQNGFVVTGTTPNRLMLDVQANVADVERAFHVALHTYRHPTEARDFFAPDTEPTVASDLPIADVSGLADYSRPYPKLHLLPKSVSPRAFTGSGPTSEYIGDDFRNAYVPGTTLTGSGQTLGLVEFDGYYTNDIVAYAQAAGGGRTNIPLQRVLLDGFSGTPTTAGNLEVSLDIELAMAMAPGLANILVIEGNPSGTSFKPNDVLNAFAASNTVKNISSSWGWSGGPSTTTDNIFKTMATQGQSYFNAAGDSDAFPAGYVDNSGNMTTPASSPYITQVGGTTLTMSGAGANYASETVWNWGNEIGSSENGVGSSGGVSTYYSIPVWQLGINSFLINGGSTTKRNIPDVALTADNVYATYGNGSSTAGSYLGGTSCAAPLWAAFMALVNQQLVTASGSATNSVGFINTAIYEIANESIYNSAFNDITTGNNTSSNSLNAFYAVPGYDLCTGLGSPAGTNLINALLNPDPLVVVSNTGFNAIASPAGILNLSSQTFYLTNISAAPLTWSLINTSAWMNASPGGGTLAVSGSNAVVVSLNTVASNLVAGTYSASLWFTNVTSNVGHSRFFTLMVSDPLTIQPTNNYSFFGPSGGLFYPGTQNIIFTNQSASAQNWSLINTSAWLSVSSSSGSLAGNSSVFVAVSTNTATTALANGTYSTTLLLSNQTSHLTQPIEFSASVGQLLVQNGGFELGNLNFWTLSGSSSFSVSTTATYVHSGAYGLDVSGNSLGYLTQNLPTMPGQTYQLSFWFYVTSTHTGQAFQANWNGTTVYSTASPPTSWNNQKLIVTATSTNTPLQFGLNSGSSFSHSFALDDISVTPVNLPVITQSPISQTNLIGSNIVFTAAASGTATLNYQWCTNGVNLANGGIVSGATTSTLTLTGITTNYAGNYTVVVTNAYGAITSSVAVLTVVSPPSLTSSTLTNRTIQCGSNTNIFSITTAGTAPLFIQWQTNGMPVTSATNTTFALTNLHFATITNVAVVLTNAYGSLTSNAVLTVQDTLAPVITLNSTNPFYLELGSIFTNPGATALDACAGSVAVIASGTVNTNAIGTNTIFYTASDGVNNATNTRTVIVRDTTPPTILWSFTNLMVAANSNCVALLTNVTGTNFILATDLSGALSITQSPTNNSILPLGTNVVVITVADASGNKSYSTNVIVVQDQTPPVIFSQPHSVTNFIGTTATFGVFATACTPLAFQWYSNNTLTIFTNTTLTISNLALSAAGNYYVVASANGGATTSAVAALTVNLYPPGISAAALDFNSGFNLNLSGSPGYTYILEATTNLLPFGNWQPIATNTLGTNGVWSFTDSSATNIPFQFYRLELAP